MGISNIILRENKNPPLPPEASLGAGSPRRGFYSKHFLAPL